MASAFQDLFKALSQEFNPNKIKFEDIPEDKLNNLKKLNETLGNLYYVTKQKQMFLTNALLAPVGVMVGGDLIQVAGADSPNNNDLNNLPFVAPSKPTRALYSVATVLANILKRHEKDLIEIFGEDKLKNIVDLLKSTYKKEQEVYKNVFMMNEIQEHLANGNIDDKSIGKLKELVKKGREAHKKQMEETKNTFSNIGNLLVSSGLPYGSISYL